MRLNTAKFPELNFLGVRYRPQPTALNPAIEAAFGTTPIMWPPTPKVEICWTGFTNLLTHPEMVAAMEQGCGTATGVFGCGIITLAAEFFSDGMRSASLLPEDILQLAEFLKRTFVRHFDFQAPLILDLCGAPEKESPKDAASFQFSAATPCSMTQWQNLYQLHSLELTAASAYHKLWVAEAGGEQEEITEEDISGNRTLN